MRLNYKKVGDFIKQSKLKNDDGRITRLLGVNLDKEFMPSVANLNGVDLTSYKVIKRGQFGCKLMSVGRDGKVPISRLVNYNEAIISSAYFVFEVKDEAVLNAEYLMMWFSRSESDRFQWFQSGGDIRGRITWEDFGNLPINIPSIETQQKIVIEYHTITKRIQLNEQLNQKLEETAQALYKHWFVDFEFPAHLSGSLSGAEGYKSSGGAMVYNAELDGEIPEGWEVEGLGQFTEIEMGQSPIGTSYNTDGIGTPLVNGPVEFGNYFTKKQKWTTKPTKLSKQGDLIVCVRGSTTGRYVKSDGIYCLGRGVCSIRNYKYQRFADELFKINIYELLTFVTGSTFPNWDRDTLSNYKVLIPSDDLLKLYCEKIESLYRVIENLFNEIVKINEIQTLLLSKMATVGSEEKIVTD